MNYNQIKETFRAHNLTDKVREVLTARVVFTEDSFTRVLTEEQRTYEFTSHNKVFLPNMIGYSIFGSSIDGVDTCVRLERYMADEQGGAEGWKVEKGEILCMN
jgi:hypothetical protein